MHGSLVLLRQWKDLLAMRNYQFIDVIPTNSRKRDRCQSSSIATIISNIPSSTCTSNKHSMKRQSRSRRKSLILSSVGDTSNVPKNNSGGVALGTDDCDAAIEFFGDGQGHITHESLKKVLRAFGPDAIMSDKEVKRLMNGRRYLEKKDFEESFHNEVRYS